MVTVGVLSISFFFFSVNFLHIWMRMKRTLWDYGFGFDYALFLDQDHIQIN